MPKNNKKIDSWRDRMTQLSGPSIGKKKKKRHLIFRQKQLRALVDNELDFENLMFPPPTLNFQGLPGLVKVTV